MKIFTNKEWELMKDALRLEWGLEKANLEVRNAKLKYLESLFNISLDKMENIEDISNWYVNYKTNLRLELSAKTFYQGARSGIDALADSIIKHNIIDLGTIEDLRTSLLLKLGERIDEETKKLDNK